MVFASCETSNKNPKTPGVDNLTRNEAQEYIRGLAKQLAEGTSSSENLGKSNMKSNLMKASSLNKMLTEEKIGLSELSSDVPSEIMVEGEPKTLVLEVFNEEKLKENITSTGTLQKKAQLPGYGVIEDDEIFWDSSIPYVTVPVYLSYDENGTTSVVEESWILPYASDIDSIDDVFNMAIDEKMLALEYPMFVISMETPVAYQQEPPVEPTLLQKGMGPLGYLTLKGIRLKVERDGWSHEELELWYGKQFQAAHESIPGVQITQTVVKYGWKMNGNSRIDASGVSRYFSDVNKKHKWYADQGWDVRLLQLDEVPRTIVAWEDDDRAGVIEKFELVIIPTFIDLSNGSTINPHIANWQAWNMETNSIASNKEIITKVGGFSLFDPDDRFGESAVYNITNASVLARFLENSNNNGTFSSNSASNGSLNDIHYKFSWSQN